MSYSEAFGPALVIQHTGQVFPLAQEPITIGRKADNSLILADPEVSGHANGTYVNERRITGTEPLRHRDVIRVGNTMMDMELEPARQEAGFPPPADQGAGAPSKDFVLPGIITLLLIGITAACIILAAAALLGSRKGVPTVTMQSPPDGAQIVASSEIILQATASGASDITLIELSVDGVLVATATSPDPGGTSSLTVAKPWTFDTPGQHVVSAVARSAEGKTSKIESVEVTVVPVGSDIVPDTTPTASPDEPTYTPEPTASMTPTPEPGAPEIEYFRANPQSIAVGGCTKLEWGTVSGASEAGIEPGVGGVATPGSTTVCPVETTSYVLTAKGPGGSTTASTTVSVSGALADLMVDAIAFDPNPPVKGQDTEVRITIRNGGAGAAGAFNWDWAAGTDANFDGRLGGLNAGDTMVVTVRWKPADAYARLSTKARVDTSNEVPETDKSNNELVAIVQVVEGAPGPGTVTLQSQAPLDGYRGNDGSGSSRQDVLVGNGETTAPSGELVWRGFMSFDLSSIPGGSSIEDAELRFFQAKVGGDPYVKLGNLILEHVDYGSSLDASAFDVPALNSTRLDQQTSPGAWYVLADRTIAAWVGNDVAAGRPHFQVRLRWTQEVDGDGKEDFAGIESGDNFFGTGNVPQLVVTYGQ
jgi:hypothetical protein